MNRTPVKAPRPIDSTLLERPERPRSNNRRAPNAHLKGPQNEYGIIIPSDKIENYIPGLNNNVFYTMNNIRTGKPVTAYAQRQMNAAKATYKAQRNVAINNANRKAAEPRWAPKRTKTERKSRKTRRKN